MPSLPDSPAVSNITTGRDVTSCTNYPPLAELVEANGRTPREWVEHTAWAHHDAPLRGFPSPNAYQVKPQGCCPHPSRIANSIQNAKARSGQK